MALTKISTAMISQSAAAVDRQNKKLTKNNI